MPPVATDDFSVRATATLKALRRTTAEVLAACQGLDRAVDVAERLGLDRSLAWKIWQVGRGTKALPSFAHVPGRGGFRQFIDAAAARGNVSESTLADARAAYAAFEELTRVYAGDRASAGSMLGLLSDEGRSRLETAIRRDGYRSNAYFLGVQAATLYQLDLLLPPDAVHQRRVARVRGHFGLRRNRSNVPWVVSRSTLVSDDGPTPHLVRSPLRRDATPSADEIGPLLLREFSSNPLPQLARQRVREVTVEDVLLPGPLGQVGAADIVTGELIAWNSDARSEIDANTMAVTTPCERLCFDFIGPTSMVGGPTLKVHSTVQTEHPFAHPCEYLIPVTESFENLGDPMYAAPTPEIPHHGAIIDWALRESGVRSLPMTLWRVCMRFPPVPSCVAASYRLDQATTG